MKEIRKATLEDLKRLLSSKVEDAYKKYLVDIKALHTLVNFQKMYNSGENIGKSIELCESLNKGLSADIMATSICFARDEGVNLVEAITIGSDFIANFQDKVFEHFSEFPLLKDQKVFQDKKLELKIAMGKLLHNARNDAELGRVGDINYIKENKYSMASINIGNVESSQINIQQGDKNYQAPVENYEIQKPSTKKTIKEFIGSIIKIIKDVLVKVISNKIISVVTTIVGLYFINS